MHVSTSNLPWFAIRVKSRCERNVSNALREKGYEEYLPLYWCRRRWSDRVKDLELPLFSGYLFCRFDPLQKVPILATPGVANIVGQGKIPYPVRGEEIEAIRIAAGSGRRIEPCAYLKIGRRVRIEQGSLRGLEGVLLRIKGQDRLVIGIELLQRAVAVEVSSDWIIPCDPQIPNSVVSQLDYDH